MTAKNDTSGVELSSSGSRFRDLQEITLDDTDKGHQLKIHITSWNVGNADPSSQWPTIFKDMRGDEDLVVLGLQESTFSIKTKSSHKSEVMASINHTKEILSRQLTGYTLVKHASRAQMQLYVYVNKAYTGKISNVQERVENTGFLHVFPNKGGLLVTLEADATRLAFISCHLCAHEGVAMCAMRNSSVAEILGGARCYDTRFDITAQAHHTFWFGDMNYRCTFSPEVPKSDTREEISEEHQAEVAEKMKLIEDRDEKEGEQDDEEEEEGTVSSSDKNKLGKKAQKALDRAKVLALITTESWPALLELDELNREVAAHRVLSGFTPVVPAFPPTFKRRRHISIASRGPETAGSRCWDLIDTDVEMYRPPSGVDSPDTVDAAAPSIKVAMSAMFAKAKKDDILDHLPENHVRKYYDAKRIPSFTDRILTHSLPRCSASLVCESFLSVEEAESSDHKPVQGVFTLQTSAGADDILVEQSAEPFFGNPSALMEQGLALELVCTKMKGHNLAEMDDAMFGGGSDPFIVFSSDIPQIMASDKEARSSTIFHNLNPDWGKEEVVIPLLTRDVDGLSRHAHLLLSVWDQDKTKSNDLIGVAVVSLRDIIDACSRWPGATYNVVSEPVLNNGLVMGHVSCSLGLRMKGENSVDVIRHSFQASEHKKALSSIKRRTKNECCLLI